MWRLAPAAVPEKRELGTAGDVTRRFVPHHSAHPSRPWCGLLGVGVINDGALCRGLIAHRPNHKDIADPTRLGFDVLGTSAPGFSMGKVC